MKKLIIYYFFFLLSVFLILSSGVIDSQDGFQYLAVARNIYYTGKPTAPVYEYNERKNIHMSTYVFNGNTYSPTGLGFSLAMLPAVAITDVVYKIYGIFPPVHFPLENDWLIFLTASLTNSFFAALLGVTIFAYLLELGLSKKQALFTSLTGLFATNLLVYAKHAFPHMMFVSFLVLSFFFVKKYSKTKKNLYLIFAGVAFGINSITYNQTFLLAVIPLGVYFLILIKFRISSSSTRSLLRSSLFFLLGLLPFIIIYIWFEKLRSGSTQTLANPVAIVNRGIAPFKDIPIAVYFEGLFGQLFSPGRSFFLYSPILLIIIFFWHKIKKVVFPEVLVFITLSIISILFYASQRTFDPVKGVTGIWHGESSWGPRYLTPLIPFGILVVGLIFTQLKRMEKIFVVFPLLLVGFYIEILGMVMPYQIKYQDLQDRFFVNATEFTNFTYSNFLPRYSPIIMMSKKLVKLVQTFPKTFDHGLYNVRFYDGIDFPFNVGPERWRVIEGRGYISFDDKKNSPVKRITIGFINHPLEEASYSASVQTYINNQPIGKSEILLPKERKLIDLSSLPEGLLQSKQNMLVIDVRFKSSNEGLYLSEKNQYRDDPRLYENKNVRPKEYIPQILGMVSFSINGNEVNKESLDFPYVSSIGPPITGVHYQTYGGTNKDPWKSWDIHTQIYERVPDFWWIKALYYWDLPKNFFMIVFIINLLSILYFGRKLRVHLNEQ